MSLDNFYKLRNDFLIVGLTGRMGGGWAETKLRVGWVKMCLRLRSGTESSSKYNTVIELVEITEMRIRMCLRQAQAPRVTRWLSLSKSQDDEWKCAFDRLRHRKQHIDWAEPKSQGVWVKMCLRQAQAPRVVVNIRWWLSGVEITSVIISLRQAQWPKRWLSLSKPRNKKN